MIIQVLFFVISVSLTLFFFVYGFNHYYLLTASRRYHTPKIKPLPVDRPTVCIHLPIYNEKYVVRRLVESCANMAAHYDRTKARILLLDDSTDDTYDEVKKITAEYAAKGFRIEMIHRDNRQGFKAGALQAALDKTTEEYVALFDADFIPEPDFLDRTIPFFVQDPHLGIIQSRWCHLNRNYNLLTFAVAILIDIHFIVEQPGRYVLGLYQNFNGSGGVLRKKAILEAGGWQSDTLTEDLDLSYRMQLRDYKMLYLKNLDSPAELPPTVPSYKQQQGRWANGSLRTAKKILPAILRKDGLEFRQRLQAFIHLTGYFIHPLMTISFIVTCIGTLANLNNLNAVQLYIFSQVQGLIAFGRALAVLSFERSTWMFLGPLIVLCTIGPWISSMLVLRKQKYSFFRNLAGFLVLLLLGFGLSLSNTWEIAKGVLTKRSWEFARTPKYADLDEKTGWQNKKYQAQRNPIWLLEFIFSFVGIICIGFAIAHANFGALLVLVPFTTAYCFVFMQTIRQSRSPKAA